MKTLREQLLERAERPEVADRLAAMRAELVARVAGGDAARREPESVVDALRAGSVPEFFRAVWRELVLPVRGVWGGLAAAWVAMLLADALGGAAPGARFQGEGRPDAAQFAGQLAVWLEQRRNLAAHVLGERGGASAGEGAAPTRPEKLEPTESKPLSVIENASARSWV